MHAPTRPPEGRAAPRDVVVGPRGCRALARSTRRTRHQHPPLRHRHRPDGIQRVPARARQDALGSTAAARGVRARHDGRRPLDDARVGAGRAGSQAPVGCRCPCSGRSIIGEIALVLVCNVAREEVALVGHHQDRIIATRTPPARRTSGTAAGRSSSRPHDLVGDAGPPRMQGRASPRCAPARAAREAAALPQPAAARGRSGSIPGSARTRGGVVHRRVHAPAVPVAATPVTTDPASIAAANAANARFEGLLCGARSGRVIRPSVMLRTGRRCTTMPRSTAPDARPMLLRPRASGEIAPRARLPRSPRLGARGTPVLNAVGVEPSAASGGLRRARRTRTALSPNVAGIVSPPGVQWTLSGNVGSEPRLSRTRGPLRWRRERRRDADHRLLRQQLRHHRAALLPAGCVTTARRRSSRRCWVTWRHALLPSAAASPRPSASARADLLTRWTSANRALAVALHGARDQRGADPPDVAVAVAPTEWLRVGAAIQPSFGHFAGETMANAIGSQSPATDIRTAADAWGFFGGQPRGDGAARAVDHPRRPRAPQPVAGGVLRGRPRRRFAPNRVRPGAAAQSSCFFERGDAAAARLFRVGVRFASLRASARALGRPRPDARRGLRRRGRLPLRDLVGAPAGGDAQQRRRGGGARHGRAATPR